jgi:hypothetical protein
LQGAKIQHFLPICKKKDKKVSDLTIAATIYIIRYTKWLFDGRDNGSDDGSDKGIEKGGITGGMNLLKPL